MSTFLFTFSHYQAKKDARLALTQHGFKIPSSEQLSTKRVDATTLEVSLNLKI